MLTVHREVNTNKSQNLKEILIGLNKISKYCSVVFPLHPRTQKYISKYKLDKYLNNLLTIPPVNFFDMMKLLSNSFIILTDSGGIQKEAYFYKIPCLTLRDETEWIETIDIKSNILVGANSNDIVHNFNEYKKINMETKIYVNLYGLGNSSN